MHTHMQTHTQTHMAAHSERERENQRDRKRDVSVFLEYFELILKLHSKSSLDLPISRIEINIFC